MSEEIIFKWANNRERHDLRGECSDTELWKKEAVKRENWLFIAKRSGQIVGYVFYNDSVLFRIFVEPQARGINGISTRLLHTSLREYFRENPELSEVRLRALPDPKPNVPAEKRKELLEKWYSERDFEKEDKKDMKITRETVLEKPIHPFLRKPRSTAPKPQRKRAR